MKAEPNRKINEHKETEEGKHKSNMLEQLQNTSQPTQSYSEIIKQTNRQKLADFRTKIIDRGIIAMEIQSCLNIFSSTLIKHDFLNC